MNTLPVEEQQQFQKNSTIEEPNLETILFSEKQTSTLQSNQKIQVKETKRETEKEDK